MATFACVNMSIFLMSPPPDLLELSKNSSSISCGMFALTPEIFTMGYDKYGLTFNSFPHKVNGPFSSTVCATETKFEEIYQAYACQPSLSWCCTNYTKIVTNIEPSCQKSETTQVIPARKF